MATTAISIDPTGIYDDALLCDLLGVSAQTLTRARRSGDLRHTRKGQRILYLGNWVLEWLQVDAHQDAAGGPSDAA
jgi:hypothetical protein